MRGAIPAGLLAAALFAAGCRGPVPPGTWIAPSPEVDALLREAEAALHEDRPFAAGEAARRAAALDPASADVLRMVQAARVASGDDVGARSEAEAAAGARPDDPTALYLLARTEPDRRDAARLLRRSVEGDPGNIWARLGLVQVQLSRQDFSAALAELDAARATAPRHPWVWILRAQADAQRKSPDQGLVELMYAAQIDPGSIRAREALARQLRRIPGSGSSVRKEAGECFRLVPRSPVAAAAWREALGEDAAPGELAEAVVAVGVAEAAGTAGLAARHLRGVARLLLGEAEAAVPDLRAALDACEDRTAALDDLRLALFLLGRYGEALDAEESATPPGVLDDPASETAPLRASLRRTAAALAAAPDDPDLLARFSDECRAAGWLRESSLLAARRVAIRPSDPDALADAADAARSAHFLDDLRLYWAGAYHSYASGEGGEGVDGALASLRAISLQRLGMDVTEGISRRSFPLIGEVAESVRATGPCADWFRRHGLALLVGAVGSDPVEARLVRVLSLRRETTESILGRPFPVTVVVGEGLLVPSRREVGGAVLGGATIGDLVFVDLEGVGRWAGAALRARRNADLRAALATAPREVPAADGDEVRSLRLPGRLSDRIALSVDAWEDPRRALSDFLDAARCHEFAHAADSERYLPPLAHPYEGLRLLLRGGLSAAGSVAVLEGDAEIAALAACREPRASLATLVSYLPGRDGALPHSRGYHGALEDLIDVLLERGVLPDRAVAVRLLDGVDPEALRSAAREVCRRRGLRAE